MRASSEERLNAPSLARIETTGRALMTDSSSGGVNLTANSNTIGGDVTGRDKIVQITTNNYYGGADGLSRELMRAPSPQPLRVLAVIASPVAGLTENDLPPGHLSGRAEWAKLREAARVAPMLLARLRPPTAAELRAMLSPNRAGAFNIVHFICHGAPGALALEDERGLTAIVPAAEIARDVRDGQIDLVVVNACYSAAGDAQSIAQSLVAAGVRSVVAHRWPLIDQAAVVFSQVLYRELAAGRALRAAFDEAVRITTDRFDAERGNAVLLGDEALTFSRPIGPVQSSQVIENAALPDETARFFGRRAELLRLADLLANDHLRGAALTGIGGIGKSALALEAADRHAWRFPGGVAYVRASEFGFSLDAALIDLARSLGVNATGQPARDLLAYLNATPCLLVLDNLERAGRELPRLAEVINALNFDGGSKVLLTLRPPLSDRFHDLREINLHAGLDAANALAYVQFIAANEGAPLQWQNPAEAGALVARVSGHPELMRLTVFRSKQTPWARVKQELANLSGRLDEALQELIGKQVEQAGEMGRTALARLAIFPQPRVLCEAALAACGEAADGLDKLVQAGVIAFESDGAERYALHATAVDWAKKHGAMQEAGMQDAKLRVIGCYAQWGNEHSSDYDALQAEHDNMLAALDWAWETKDHAESQKAIVNDALGLREFWGVRGYWTERTTWLQRANEIGSTSQTDDDLKQYSTNLHNLAVTLVNRGDLDGALDLYRQSLDINERLGDAQGKAATLHQMAMLFDNQGDIEKAWQMYQESLVLKERLGDLYSISFTLYNMAQIEQRRGNHDTAVKMLERVVEIDKQLQLPDLKSDSEALERARRLQREWRK
jgi:tetratricopeptide (TPR) repeat protein